MHLLRIRPGRHFGLTGLHAAITIVIISDCCFNPESLL